MYAPSPPKPNILVKHFRANGHALTLTNIDIASSLFLGLCVAFLLSSYIGATWLLHMNQLQSAIATLLAGSAFFVYGYNTHVQRILRLTEHTAKLLDTLRGRWDEIRKDEMLTRVFTGNPIDLTSEEKTKLRFFIYTLFDTYEYACHLISRGYFDRAEGLANQYEDMMTKSLRIVAIKEIWNETDQYGRYTFQGEYSSFMQDVVKDLLLQIEPAAPQSNR